MSIRMDEPNKIIRVNNQIVYFVYDDVIQERRRDMDFPVIREWSKKHLEELLSHFN